MSAQTVPISPPESKVAVSDSTLYNRDARSVLENIVRDIVILRNAVDAIVTVMNANKTLFDNHTHKGDGAQSGTYNTTKPDATASSIGAATSVSVLTTAVTASNITATY